VKTANITKIAFLTLDIPDQEASPWTTFGHVAGNGALMEAMEGEARIHVIDISSTFCTQWPTFLEALATQTKETPLLRLTTIVSSPDDAALTVMQQVMTRLDRFARLMGVPFESTVIQQPALEDLDLAALNLREDEALAINCIQTIHQISEVVTDLQFSSPRDKLLSTFRNAKPKVPPMITVVILYYSLMVLFFIFFLTMDFLGHGIWCRY
jgi:hypothetical protein